MMSIALCIWGDMACETSSVQHMSDQISTLTGRQPSIFSKIHSNKHMALWLSNYSKRQRELQTKTLYDAVFYLDVASVNISMHKLCLSKPKKFTVYHIDDKIACNFYCDSMTGDLAALYQFNIGNAYTHEKDFRYHLLSYRLQLERVKHE